MLCTVNDVAPPAGREAGVGIKYVIAGILKNITFSSRYPHKNAFNTPPSCSNPLKQGLGIKLRHSGFKLAGDISALYVSN